MSVKSYAPALLDIFKLASEKEFVFNCKTNKAALALRARLHALRRDMRKEQHWLTPVAENVKISVRDSKIIARPADNEIVQDLEAALLQQGLRKETV